MNIYREALQRIADIDEGDCEKYVKMADEIAVEALVDGALYEDTRPGLLATLKQCQTWFERWSPTAELVNNLGRTEHPMLTMIKTAIATAEGR